MAREWRKVSAEEARAHPLYGVKNWLAVFAFGVLLVPLREFGGLNGEAHRLGISVGQLLDSNASFKAWVTLVLATEVAMVVAILGLMLSKSSHFRVATSAMWVALFPLLAVLAFVTGAPGSGEAIGLGFFPWVISCLVWVTYLHRSRRVRVTFEHSVLAADVRPTATAPLVAPQSAAPVSSVDVGLHVMASPSTVAASPQGLRSPAGPLDAAHVPPATAAQPAPGDGEEELWAQALDELNGVRRKQGLWARAFAQASGNESAAQAQYLSERVRQLSEERAALNRAEVERQAERQRSDEQARQVVVQRASAARASFASGKRLSPTDVELLVEATEVDPSLVVLTDRSRGESLLHWAARHNLKAEAAALIAKGANADAPNGDGRRPYELSEDHELRGILRSAAHGSPSS